MGCLPLPGDGRARGARNKLFLIVLAALLLFGCAEKADETDGLYTETQYAGEFYAMDTMVSVVVYSDSETAAKEAIASAEEAFMLIDGWTNRFSVDSYISRANNSLKPLPVPHELAVLVRKALDTCIATDYALDISMGALSDLWNFGERTAPPPPEEIGLVLSTIGAGKIEADTELDIIIVSPGTVMDLGALSKGYATDLAADALRSHGIEHGYINAGGNVYCVGTRPDGSPWRIGVRNPRGGDGYSAVILAEDCSLVTSGDDQRFFYSDGVRYHHILDPATGYPAVGTASITIVAESSVEADMLSTAGFVMGIEELSRRFPGIKAAALTEGTDGELSISITPGLEDQMAEVFVTDNAGF